MSNERAARRRQPRDEHRAQRHLDDIAKRLEAGHDPRPRPPVPSKLLALFTKHGIAGTRRTPFTGSRPGRYATPRRIARSRHD